MDERHKSRRLNRQQIVQNSMLIWLDPNIGVSNDDIQSAQTQLQRIVQTVEIFIDFDQCIDFLTDIQDVKVFLIISKTVPQHILRLIHNIEQLYAVYIFDGKSIDDDDDAGWMQQGWKVKGIYTKIESIGEVLQQTIKQCDQNAISISFIPNDEDVSNQKLDQLDPTFMYTQILKEILLETQYNEQSIKDFVTYCRNIDCTDTNTIEKFEREYHAYQPIRWYTCEGYLYSMLNRALRTLETDAILKIGFFIHDLHENIKQLHSEQLPVHSSSTSSSFTVYRGQGLSKIDFERLKRTHGGLVSFNNFLSTSLDKDISLIFAESNLANPDSFAILFVININSSISSVPFADINGISNFDNENEILFSMHTVFRIGEIKQLDNTNRFWQVELKLTGDDDQQLHQLTDRLRIETAGAKSWQRLGLLLMKIGHNNKAEEVYMSLLNHTVDEDDKIVIYNQLGILKQQQGEYDTAISFCEEALEIARKVFHKNDPNFATILSNVALVYDSVGEYTKATSLSGQALEIRQKFLSSTDPNLALSYMNLGMMYYKKSEYVNALSCYEKAYEIYRKALPTNHPDLATCYNHTACAYDLLGNYSNAILFHKKAIDIRERVLPPNHPDFTVSYINIAAVYAALGDYTQALSYNEKARQINEKILSPNHPILASCYNELGEIYHKIGEYRRALSYHEKALEIRQKILPSNHTSLITSYHNMASIYNTMSDYKKAILTQKKVHELLESAAPINYTMLATSYSNMAAYYTAIHDYQNALLSNEKALEIRERILPSNHPDLGISYNNIGGVYFEMGQYQPALPFLERALHILKVSLPVNHPTLQTVQKTIASVKRRL